MLGRGKLKEIYFLFKYNLDKSILKETWFPRLVTVISGRSKGASEKSGILCSWEGPLGTPLPLDFQGTLGCLGKPCRLRFFSKGVER